MAEQFDGFPELYRPSTDFSATTPFNKAALDTEFDNIGLALRHLVAILREVLRDDWSLGDGVVTLASLSAEVQAAIASGDIELTFATQAEAEAGTAEDVLMSPLRVAQAIIAQAVFASQAEAEAGVVDDKYMSPLRTAQAIAALAEGGGGATGEVVELSGAGPHQLLASYHGKTLYFTHNNNVTLVLPQTSTEAIPVPFVCRVIGNINGGGLTIDPEGADQLIGGDVGVLNGNFLPAEIYKVTAGAPNVWLASGFSFFS